MLRQVIVKNLSSVIFFRVCRQVNPYDNFVAENFFSCLIRLHSALGWISGMAHLLKQLFNRLFAFVLNWAIHGLI